MTFLSRKKLKEACDTLRDRELLARFPQEAAGFLNNKNEREAERTLGAFRGRRLIRKGLTVAAMLALLILAGVVLGPKAYARIQLWITGQSGEWNTLKPISVHPEAAFPAYRLGWRPERFERCYPLTDDKYEFSEEYQNDYLVDVPMDIWEKIVDGRYDRTDLYPEPGKLWTRPGMEDNSFFGWGYFKISQKAENSVMYLQRIDIRTGETRILEEGQWEIGDWDVLYYLYYSFGAESFPDGQKKTYRYDTICCIWMDQEHDVAFRIDGTLTKEEAQKIIENIVIR